MMAHHIRRLPARIAAATVAAAAGMLLAACSSGGSTASGPTTLSFWARSDDSAFISTMVKDFNATHSDVKLNLTVVPTNNFVQKFTTAVANGNGPDVASINLIDLPYYSAAHALTNVTSMAHSLGYYKDLSPAHLQLATYNGQLYALPFSGDASVLYYNTDLFKKAGLNPDDPPKTWAQMLADAKKITALGTGYYGFYFPGLCPGCNGFTMYPQIWASGGQILTGAGTGTQKATLTSSPPVAAALNFYHTMWAQKLVPPSAKTSDVSTWLTPFESNKVGMEAIGSFAVATLKQQKNLHFNLAFLPGQNGGYSSYAGGDEIAIPSGSKHQVQAEEILKWATSTAAQQEIAKLGVVPTRVSIAENYYPKLDPRYKVLAQAMAHGTAPYTTHFEQLMNTVSSPWQSLINDAIFGGQVSKGLSQAQTRFQAILAQPAG
jgi:multiple sugar transport system substrate-binding protein